MAKPRKTRCKWKKDDIKDDLEALKEVVKDAKYICKKCGRVAKAKGYLCKPQPL